MTVTVSKVPLFTSGEIRFSALRDSFKQTGTQIRSSELRRITTVSREQTNPIVPDATENSNIATSSDWRTSQFRNSIKTYDLIQSSTNTNLIIENQSWNGNLSKSIRKVFFVNGVIGATSTASDALTLGSDAYNLELSVSGEIYGAGGSNGAAGSGGTRCVSSGTAGGDGTAGTDAISITSDGRVIVSVQTSGRVYAGGGGGAGGSGGANGPNGTCFYYTYYNTGQSCGSVPGCGGNTLISSTNLGGCNCQTTGKGKNQRTVCYNSIYRSYCRVTNVYEVCGGAGGAGGSGRSGRGYNNTAGDLSPAIGGSAGESPFCSSPDLGYAGGGIASFGGGGENGGTGGDWGQNGGATGSRSGGAAGLAVRGSFYTVQGSTGADNIKGSY